MARTKTLKRRLYNVSAAVNYLLDEQHPLNLRAIKLYETQIAVFFGEKLNVRQRKQKEFPDHWLAVSSDLLAAARVCSTIRLLQHIQKTQHLGETSLPNLLDNPEAREVLGRILEKPGGCGSSPSPSDPAPWTAGCESVVTGNGDTLLCTMCRSLAP